MAQGKTDNLEAFAKRIESRIREGLGGSDSMERLICRLLTAKKNPQVSATMAHKWVEWRYGKAKETLKVEGHIEHTVFDASKLSEEQLSEAEAQAIFTNHFCPNIGTSLSLNFRVKHDAMPHNSAILF